MSYYNKINVKVLTAKPSIDLNYILAKQKWLKCNSIKVWGFFFETTNQFLSEAETSMLFISEWRCLKREMTIRCCFGSSAQIPFLLTYNVEHHTSIAHAVPIHNHEPLNAQCRMIEWCMSVSTMSSSKAHLLYFHLIPTWKPIKKIVFFFRWRFWFLAVTATLTAWLIHFQHVLVPLCHSMILDFYYMRPTTIESHNILLS